MDTVLQFIPWHYTKGLELFITVWMSYLELVVHYFSLPLLLKTTFAPWKRLVESDNTPGFDIGKYFETAIFNGISRVIGAIVRLCLFVAGIVLIFLTLIFGTIGIFSWIIIPLLGIPFYRKYLHRLPFEVARLLSKAKKSESFLETIFDSSAGAEVSRRMGIEKNEFVREAVLTDFNFVSGNSFEEILSQMIEKNTWSESFFTQHNTNPEDLLLAASLWDKRIESESEIVLAEAGAPGVGLELIFGYTPTLNTYSENMSLQQSYSHHLIGRESVVHRMERILNGGSNVMLSGLPGVGKKTVVFEFAERARVGKLGQVMAYRRVMMLDHNALLSTEKDVNAKKHALRTVLLEAAEAGNIILVLKDLHRLVSKEVEGYDFTDILEELFAREDMKIIAITNPVDYERFIVPNMRIRKHFELVEITPPEMEDAMEIVLEAALHWEQSRNITITIPALRKILVDSDQYITETPFPEKALELLDAVILAAEQQNHTLVDINTVVEVFTERTGIPAEQLSVDNKKRLANLEDLIHENLVNQTKAINLLAKSLRSRSIGVGNKDKPIGSFLFLGPTGVGKTETAKVLATTYYGSTSRIIRFDMAEYAGSDGFERLVGSVNKNYPGTLTTAIKNNPASLLLLDEIEKASPEIYNLFLRLLDEGIMTDAFGKEIVGKHLFIVGTSNAGAEYIRQLVTKGESDIQKKVVDYVLEQGIFSPEFINRFDGVVVYEPLTKDHLVQIARLMLTKFAASLKKQNLYLNITDAMCAKLAEDGYDPAFGARPMSRIVNLTLGDIVGKAILNDTISSGDIIELVPEEGVENYSLVIKGKK